VTFGDVFAGLSGTEAKPFVNEKGSMFVTFTAADEKGLIPNGTLAYLEIEALVSGKPVIEFDKDMFAFQTAQGKLIPLKLQ
jgi:hypothetical protein